MTGKSVAENLANIKKQIENSARRAGRSPQDIRLIAVSKYATSAQISEAAVTGQSEFGENYLQKALDKIREFEPLRLQWHFIGRLQKNKIKYITGVFTHIQSIDDVAMAERISAIAAEKKLTQKILMQVNVASERSKGGVPPEKSSKVLKELQRLSNIEVVGLMTLPPLTENEREMRGYFRTLSQLRAALSQSCSIPLPHLSMGTSHDFLAAIEEGATMVRVGSAIFAT